MIVAAYCGNGFQTSPQSEERKRSAVTHIKYLVAEKEPEVCCRAALNSLNCFQDDELLQLKPGVLDSQPT